MKFITYIDLSNKIVLNYSKISIESNFNRSEILIWSNDENSSSHINDFKNVKVYIVAVNDNAEYHFPIFGTLPQNSV